MFFCVMLELLQLRIPALAYIQLFGKWMVLVAGVQQRLKRQACFDRLGSSDRVWPLQIQLSRVWALGSFEV